MSQQPPELQIRAVYPFPDVRAMWVRTGPNSAVPSKFQAQIHLGSPELTVVMAVVVGPGGRALIREFGVSPKDVDTAVTTRMLRKLPLDRLLRAALNAVAAEPTDRPDVHPNAFQVPGDPRDQAWVSPEPKVGRGREVAPDRVARAAEVYLEALAAGSRKPAEVVADKLSYSRATAARDIRAARDRGLLPPAGRSAGGRTEEKLSPPSSERVADDPVMPRFDDPTRWARRSDVLEGPSGAPFYDPSAEGPPPEPVPGAGPGITTPDTWLQRIRDAASIPPEARDTSLSPREIEKIMDDLAQAQEELQDRLQEATQERPDTDPAEDA